MYSAIVHVFCYPGAVFQGSGRVKGREGHEVKSTRPADSLTNKIQQKLLDIVAWLLLWKRQLKSRLVS